MPELAEVEYFRKLWDAGLGGKILRVGIHEGNRIFRGMDVELLQEALPGSKIVRSEARGKQMLFVFTKRVWLGLHLGMTGRTRVEPPDFIPGRHDHLTLFQVEQSLVFHDPRQFGRVRFSQAIHAPDWWTRLPIPVNSPDFKRKAMSAFLHHHPRLPVKSVLLLQTGFPGIGNWMADEILWRAKVRPRLTAGDLDENRTSAIWKALRFVCRGALKHVSHAFSDPPAGWLFHERWHRGGKCPLHGSLLKRESIGGRATTWCPICQP